MIPHPSAFPFQLPVKEVIWRGVDKEVGLRTRGSMKRKRVESRVAFGRNPGRMVFVQLVNDRSNGLLL